MELFFLFPGGIFGEAGAVLGQQLSKRTMIEIVNLSLGRLGRLDRIVPVQLVPSHVNAVHIAFQRIFFVVLPPESGPHPGKDLAGIRKRRPGLSHARRRQAQQEDGQYG